MSYAIKKNGSGWRAVNSQNDVASDETFSDTAPAIMAPDPATMLRSQRNSLITLTDWTQTPDAQALFTSAKKTAWLTYRQALRDVPEQSGFPTTVNWPTSP